MPGSNALEGVGLPPQSAWLINPRGHDFEPFITPVDDRGLVDIPRLIASVKATIDPSYSWPETSNIHHFYWPEENYSNDKSNSRIASPHVFRELSIHKGELPLTFHNWLHEVTEPPTMPEPEVMSYRIEAWDVARRLFKNARRIIQWQRFAKRRVADILNHPDKLKPEFDGEDIIGYEAIRQVMDHHFRGLERHLGRLEVLPVEFRLVEPDDNVETLTKNLGKLVGIKSLTLVRSAAA